MRRDAATGVQPPHDSRHGAAAAAAGIESGNGTSPCEQARRAGRGQLRTGTPGPRLQQVITDPATRTLLGEQLAVARDAALRYPTAADAIAAGYRRITTYIPCIAAHYINTRFIDRTGSIPTRAEMLLYDGNGPDARIVGLSYYVSGMTTAPEGFAGPNDEWHQHIGLCVSVSGVVIGGTQLTADECRRARRHQGRRLHRVDGARVGRAGLGVGVGHVQR